MCTKRDWDLTTPKSPSRSCSRTAYRENASFKRRWRLWATSDTRIWYPCWAIAADTRSDFWSTSSWKTEASTTGCILHQQQQQIIRIESSATWIQTQKNHHHLPLPLLLLLQLLLLLLPSCSLIGRLDCGLLMVLLVGFAFFTMNVYP